MASTDIAALLSASEERRARRYLGLRDDERLPDRRELEDAVRELSRDVGEQLFRRVMRRVIGVERPSFGMLPLSALAEALTRLQAEREAQSNG